MGTMQERLATSGSSSRTATKSSIELINTDIVTAQLLGIPAKIRETIERQAIHRANVSAVGTLRQNTPVETGALRKSFKYDIRKYKGGDVIVGLSGADYDYVGTVQRNKSGKKVFKRNKDAPDNNRRRPAKYLHLMELGTQQRTTRSGKNRGSVTGTHFVKDTAEQLTPQFQQMLIDAVDNALS